MKIFNKVIKYLILSKTIDNFFNKVVSNFTTDEKCISIKDIKLGMKLKINRFKLKNNTWELSVVMDVKFLKRNKWRTYISSKEDADITGHYEFAFENQNTTIYYDWITYS